MTTPQPRPGIMDIKAYVGGESALTGVSRVLKLSSNEGALGPSPLAMQALRDHAEKMHRYPDGGCVKLRQALAARWGLDAERIVCGAGSDEVLVALCHAFAGEGDEVLYSQHGFLMYPIAAKSCGATPVVAPETNLTTDVDALLAAVTPRTKVVFVANPNNPTGTYLPSAEIQRLRDGLPPHVLLVLDAAYAEFVGNPDYDPGIDLVHSTDNTVMTRTFSKIFALGGLRLGWAYCPPAIADVLNRYRGPFNVSAAAQVVGVAALEDRDFFDRCRSHNDRWLPWMLDQMRGLGFDATASVANFVLVHLPTQPGRTAAEADLFLRQQGIIIRAMASYGLGEWLRITIGTEEENQAVVDALTAFKAGW